MVARFAFDTGASVSCISRDEFLKHKKVLLSQPRCKLHNLKDVGLSAFNSTKSPVTEYLEGVTLHIGCGAYEANFCVVPNASVPYLLAGDFILDYDIQLKYDRAMAALGVANPLGKARSPIQATK